MLKHNNHNNIEKHKAIEREREKKRERVREMVCE